MHPDRRTPAHVPRGRLLNDGSLQNDSFCLKLSCECLVVDRSIGRDLNRYHGAIVLKR